MSESDPPIKKAWDIIQDVTSFEDQLRDQMIKTSHEKALREGRSILSGTEFEPKGTATFFRKAPYLPSRTALGLDMRKDSGQKITEIGWAEGVLSSGILFRVECWAIDGITMLTYFIPAYWERSSTEHFFIELLEKEKLLKFKSNQKYVTPMRLQDKDIFTRVWSVNVIVADVENSYVEDYTPLKPYKKTKENRLVTDSNLVADPWYSEFSNLPTQILYHHEDQEINTRVSIYFNDIGDFVIDGSDMGEKVEKNMGDFDYEYKLTIGIEDLGKLVITLVKNNYQNNPEAFSMIQKLCKENNIDAELISWA